MKNKTKILYLSVFWNFKGEKPRSTSRDFSCTQPLNAGRHFFIQLFQYKKKPGHSLEKNPGFKVGISSQYSVTVLSLANCCCGNIAKKTGRMLPEHFLLNIWMVVLWTLAKQILRWFSPINRNLKKDWLISASAQSLRRDFHLIARDWIPKQSQPLKKTFFREKRRSV